MEFVAVSVFVIYLMPWILAEAIEHPRRGWILALLLLLGWTGLGWLGACAWVARDWPRAPRRPRLLLIGPNTPVQSRFGRRWRVGAACALTASTGLAVWQFGLEPARLPASGLVALDRPSVVVRMGPHRRWPSVGELRAPCRLGLVEREGGWQHVWLLDDCAGSMHGRSGWVRMEALRATAGDS